MARYIQDEEEALAPAAVTAYRLLLYTGARLSEIQTLKWEHIQGNRIHLTTIADGLQPQSRYGSGDQGVRTEFRWADRPTLTHVDLTPGHRGGADMAEEASLNQAWGALRVVLKDAFTFYEIKDLVGLAGIDVTRLARLEQKAGGGASKGQLITALDREIAQLDRAEKSRLLSHLTEEIVGQRPHQSESLNDYLERLGWQFADGKLVPIDVFDIAELADLPDVSRTDLLKAAARLRDGDLSGALGAALALARPWAAGGRKSVRR